MEEFLTKYAVYATFLILVVEFILGKTKLIKANSTVEAIVNVVLKIVKFVFRIEDEKKLIK